MFYGVMKKEMALNLLKIKIQDSRNNPISGDNNVYVLTSVKKQAVKWK